MKIKHVLFLTALLLSLTRGLAQNFSMDLGETNGKTVEIYMNRGTLYVTGKKGNTIELMSNYRKESLPGRAAGLKPLTANNALDNTGFGVEVKASNSVITIKNATNQELDLEVVLPDNVRLVMAPEGWQAGDILVRDFKGEIEVKSNHSDIQLLQVSGPVVANSISGDIEIVFKEINPDKPSAVSNISGFIDISFPPSAKSSLEIKNLSGEIFTDLNLEILEEKNFGPEMPTPPAPPTPPTPPANGSKPEVKVPGVPLYRPAFQIGKGIVGTTNGGGAAISLHNISGNIYLRKGK